MSRRLSKQFVCEKLILFKEVLWKLVCQKIKAFLVLKNQFKFGLKYKYTVLSPVQVLDYALKMEISRQRR